MSEEEFQQTSNRVMRILNAEGMNAAKAECDSINDQLRASKQHFEFHGGGQGHTAIFFLYDTQGERNQIYKFSLGSIKNWPGT